MWCWELIFFPNTVFCKCSSAQLDRICDSIWLCCMYANITIPELHRASHKRLTGWIWNQNEKPVNSEPLLTGVFWREILCSKITTRMIKINCCRLQIYSQESRQRRIKVVRHAKATGRCFLAGNLKKSEETFRNREQLFRVRANVCIRCLLLLLL